jgi:hypothetical protein
MKAARMVAGVIAAITASVTLLALPAAAHSAEGEPSVTCDEVLVKLKDFPDEPTTITFHITVNGGSEQTKTAQFAGPSGTAKQSISDLTSTPGELVIEAFATWFADGSNGKSEKAKVTEVCEETPTTTEGPPVEVGGAQAERSDVPTSVESAAAAAVTAEPRFTG